MTRSSLDPSLASILDSIRASVGGAERPRPEAAWATGHGAERGAGEPDREIDAPDAPAATPADSPARTEAALPAPQRTVEEFLAELIRPQVDAWLQAHLPELIQKMAAEEIARLTGNT